MGGNQREGLFRRVSLALEFFSSISLVFLERAGKKFKINIYILKEIMKLWW